MNRRWIFYIILVAFTSMHCKKTSVSPLLPGSKLVVILGSSTAFGTGANPIDSSWANKLNFEFNRESKKNVLQNLALGGSTTYTILPGNSVSVPARPAPDVSRNVDKALSLKPNFIIVNLPTNDIALGYTDDEILQNYRTIVSAIRNANVPFIITGTQPRNLGSLDARKRLRDFNSKLLAAFPDNILNYYSLLADVATLNILPAYNSGDGIHLNNKGHELIYQEVLKDQRMRAAINN